MINHKKLVKISMDKDDNSHELYLLARDYKDGIGYECDYEKAIGLYKKAIALGNTNAMVDLAMIYLNKEYIYDNESSIGIILLKEAIALGNHRAILMLARYYSVTTMKDNLGEYYDYSRATSLYMKAAANGNTSGIIGLGKMHFKLCVDNIYINKNELYRSENMYEEAIKKGSNDAILCLSEVKEYTSKDEVIDLCKKAIDNDNSEAIVKLAQKYWNENQCLNNINAIELCKKAVSKGNIRGMILFDEICRVCNLVELYREYYIKYYLSTMKFSVPITKNIYVKWHQKLHKWWPFEFGNRKMVEKCIMCLLSISKYRNNSTNLQTRYFVKGIMLIIIGKYCEQFVY
jgi:TPR repeat protein